MQTNEELNSIKFEILNAVQEARNAAEELQKAPNPPNTAALEAVSIRLEYVRNQIETQLGRVRKLLSENKATHSS